MRNLLKTISLAGLGLTFIPAILFFAGNIQLQTNFRLMIIGMVLYFGSAPFWMKSKSLEETEGAE